MGDSAEVYASYGKDAMQKDPELVDAIYASLGKNESQSLYEVPLVYPKSCRCTAVSKMPMLVFLDKPRQGRGTLVLNEKTMVVRFKLLDHKSLDDVRMLNFCRF